MSDLERNITPDAIEQSMAKDRVVKPNNTVFDAKNYLDVKLTKGQTEKSIRIRLLTIDKDSNSPFKHIYMHNVKVPKEISESGWKSYVCLEKTEGPFSEKLGHKCPFCELRRDAYEKFVEAKKLAEQLKEEGDVEQFNVQFNTAERYKEISLSNIPSEVGILRCIERDKESDGPKFWKFNIRKDKKDPENLIRKLYQNRKEECEVEGVEIENILDIDKGRDLKVSIEIVSDRDGKSTNRTSVNISTFGNQKPLSPSKELRDKWVNDSKIWSDVFVAKPYEYLEVIINGGIPWFDRNSGKWIPKEHFEKNTGIDPKDVDTDIEKMVAAKAKAVTEAVNANVDDEDDHLPF